MRIILKRLLLNKAPIRGPAAARRHSIHRNLNFDDVANASQQHYQATHASLHLQRNNGT
jgi:hypothetical protein